MRPAPTSLATRLFRLARLSFHLLHGAATTAFVLPRLTPEARAACIRDWCRKMLAILRVRVVTRGPLPDATTSGVMFVANHVSWLDIWALKQLHGMQFVAKADIRDWPLIGWLAQQTGTLFITREKRHDTGRAVRSVAQALARGECLCFFPEGTTTDGTELKSFKPSLFQAAIDTGAEVWPLAIRYPAADGGANTAVAYYGDMTLAQSLWAVLQQREIVIELDFAAPIKAAQERRQLAQQARQAIASRLPLHPRKAPGTAAYPPASAR